jgi:hypothetical protein
MRKHDPQLQEDGFHALLPHAADHLPELIREFHTETDHGLRCWLLELIGEAKKPETLPLLVEQHHSPDESFRDWAIHGLRLLDTHEWHKALFDVRCPRTPARPKLKPA